MSRTRPIRRSQVLPPKRLRHQVDRGTRGLRWFRQQKNSGPEVSGSSGPLVGSSVSGVTSQTRVPFLA